MRCELEYCIYNKDNNCRLEKIQINGYGMCEESIFISITYEKLEKLKEKQLKDCKK